MNLLVKMRPRNLAQDLAADINVRQRLELSLDLEVSVDDILKFGGEAGESADGLRRLLDAMGSVVERTGEQ